MAGVPWLLLINLSSRQSTGPMEVAVGKLSWGSTVNPLGSSGQLAEPLCLAHSSGPFKINL